MSRRRKAFIATGLTAALVPALGLLLGCCLSAPRYQGPVSDHFDGTQFFDAKPKRAGPSDMLRWQLNRERGDWPEHVAAAPGPPPPAAVTGDRLRVTFINHATLLVQMEGMNVLTDPIWAERASPLSFAGPRRVREPGIRFEDLPPIHAVLLSHNHYDHMNVETLLRLRDAHQPLFVTGLGNDLFLAEHGINARALDWGDTIALGPLTITSVENQHFSRRGLFDGDATLWTAFIVGGAQAGKVYFAGDTGYGTHFARAGRAHPGIRLALLPIGAYQPEWFMGPVHVTPAEAVTAAQDLGARTSVGMHFGTFQLADDGLDDPVRDLLTALDRAPGVRFWVLGFGEGRDVP